MKNVTNHYVKSMTAKPWQKFGACMGVPVWWLKMNDCTFYAINAHDPEKGIVGRPVHHIYISTDLPSIRGFILLHSKHFPTPTVEMRARDLEEDERSEKDWMWSDD